MRVRKARKITHRISSVTNGFVQAILPDAIPDADEQKNVLAILEIDHDRMTCAYCGDKAQHWDHLNPYVRNKQPSGYLNNAHNLVPACGPCNASKSGHDWKRWMLGAAKGSPATRKVSDLQVRIERLDALEKATALKPVDLSAIVPSELWSSYWARRKQIEDLLFDAQREAELIKAYISFAMQSE